MIIQCITCALIPKSVEQNYVNLTCKPILSEFSIFYASLYIPYIQSQAKLKTNDARRRAFRRGFRNGRTACRRFNKNDQ